MKAALFLASPFSSGAGENITPPSVTASLFRRRLIFACPDPIRMPSPNATRVRAMPLAVLQFGTVRAGKSCCKRSESTCDGATERQTPFAMRPPTVSVQRTDRVEEWMVGGPLSARPPALGPGTLWAPTIPCARPIDTQFPKPLLSLSVPQTHACAPSAMSRHCLRGVSHMPHRAVWSHAHIHTPEHDLDTDHPPPLHALSLLLHETITSLHSLPTFCLHRSALTRFGSPC